jgi:hypothetical protein
MTFTNQTTTSLQDGDGDTKIQLEESSDEDKIRFDTGGTERMLLDSNGLQINTTSVANLLIDTSSDVLQLKAKKDGTDDVDLAFLTQASGGTLAERLRITGAGNLHMLTGVDARIQLSTSGSGSSPNTGDNNCHVRGNDDTLILNAAGNGNILFQENGTERLRVNTGGNVGIGTTSPSHALTVNSGSTGVSAKLITTAATGYLQLENSGGDAGILSNGDNLALFTSSSGTERVRITSAGALCLGKTADNLTADGVTLRKHPTSGHGQIYCVGTGSSAYEGLYVYDRTNSEFEFYASYHGTIAYRALYNMSDERKKQNIQDITLGLDAVKELRPVSFDWKNDKGNDQLGFIAQEVEATSLKQLVGNYKDPNIDNLRSLNKEQMIPVLVKAVQELSTKLDAAEARIETLEG